MAEASSTGNNWFVEQASWGPGEGPGGAPPWWGGIQQCEVRCVQNRKVVVQVQDVMMQLNLKPGGAVCSVLVE